MSSGAVTVDTLRPSHRKHRHGHEHFPLDALMVDVAVQRSVDHTWVAARIDLKDERGVVLKRRFRPDALGVIVVSRRDDGNIHIIDGQHRAELCRRSGYTEPLACLVYVGLSLAEEASMFRLLNDRRKVNVIDSFRIRVVEGEPVATELADILAAHGWSVQASKSKGSFAAVSA